ncbi:hypothetical protein N0V93_008943 [Gnomoniopsis smithogilvyi]|uniref:Carbohydrate-binding domain-containing protein n=1 Tax=Gnomoniopsis smithogilvyi TaxID=1191159 RepID=A0A9W9CSC3_9PEZI|nr:hypothetical protein N0V93_008943 [Gnomoniopsis smithogilvyi]
MFSRIALTVALAAGAFAATTTNSTTLPSLTVPSCPSKGYLSYNLSSPDLEAFPDTAVEICYDDSVLHIDFLAYNETSFFYNSTYTTNGDIYNYEVMEVFIAKGTSDPTTYLEFEVAPNNVTFQGFIYNPSTNRTDGAPFDTFLFPTPIADGLLANTTLDEAAETWVSSVEIPLTLFNVDGATAAGTQWRMNFFRITTSPETFPTRVSGAWSPTPDNNLHNTPYFGYVQFI